VLLAALLWSTGGLFIKATPLDAFQLSFGRSLFAIGSNEEAVRLSGIAVPRYVCAVYVISGALAALAGIISTARAGVGSAQVGVGAELAVIAAVVIGGASLSGGVGSIGGTVVGVLIIGVLRNGLNLLGVSPFVQQVVIGLVIAAAVTFDTLGRRNR